jgi:hypothetical protein
MRRTTGYFTAAVATLLAATTVALVTTVSAGPAPAVKPPGSGAQPAGVTADDTAFLQKALDGLEPGDTLKLEPRTYRHSEVLTVDVPNVTVTGPGATLIATDEQHSAFHIAADGVVVSDLVFGVEQTTKRWEGLDQHKVTITQAKEVELHSIEITGSAAAGVYVGAGASKFLLDSVTVRNTRADGIHMTGGAHDGTVRNPNVIHSGDDGVAVVSYESDPAISRNITVYAPVVEDNSNGRGVSVVGGENITYHDVQIKGSSSAGVYVGVEGDPYFTQSNKDILISGGQLQDANYDERVNHGALLVYNGRPGHEISNVRIENLAIEDPPTGATRQVGLLSDGGRVSGIELYRLVIRSATPAPFYTNVSDESAYSITDWLVAGRPFNG